MRGSLLPECACRLSSTLPGLPEEASGQAEEEARRCLLSASGEPLCPSHLALPQQAPVQTLNNQDRKLWPKLFLHTLKLACYSTKQELLWFHR